MSKVQQRREDHPNLDNMLRMEIYGPTGIRKLIRTNLQITQTMLKGKYAAHELLFSHDAVTTCDEEEMHANEIPGRDIRIDGDGFWRDFEDSMDIQVDAGPIVHRIPCVGYVFKERPQLRISPDYLQLLDNIPIASLPQGIVNPRYLMPSLAKSQSVTLNDGTVIDPPPRDIPGRKIVVLGDTSDPWAISPLAQDASALVHEATNAWMPPDLDRGRFKDPEEVRQTAISRGHSTPDMAGSFANAIAARRLFLNHFSVKYPDPGLKFRESDSTWARVIREIEDQASRSWQMGNAIAASDIMTVEILSHEV